MGSKADRTPLRQKEHHLSSEMDWIRRSIMGTRVKPLERPGSNRNILEKAQQTLGPKDKNSQTLNPRLNIEQPYALPTGYKNPASFFLFQNKPSSMLAQSERLHLHQSICYCVYFPDRTQHYITSLELLPPCKLKKDLT